MRSTKTVQRRSLLLVALLIGLTGAVSACSAPAPSPSATPTSSRSPAATPVDNANWSVRGNLMRSFGKFAQDKTGRVAFMGGSVTNFDWREKVMDYLRQKFPSTSFDFINAGLAGTPAELGAFRLEDDVFGRGPVDLLFLEFAVNGGSVEAMEGIVRHAKTLNPNIDIVQMHMASRWFSDDLNRGDTPGVVAAHELVAEFYDNSSLHLYREVYERIKAGEFDWDAVVAPDGVHPTAFGCSVYADFITGFLEAMWRRGGTAAHPSLPRPITAYPWEHGRLVHYGAATSSTGFQEIRDWMPALIGNLKGPISFIASSKPGSTVSFGFNGRMVGLYVPVGPDASKIEYSVDGAAWKAFDTARDSWYPGASDWVRLSGFVLEPSLADADHTITLRTIADAGHVFRLYRLMVG